MLNSAPKGQETKILCKSGGPLKHLNIVDLHSYQLWEMTCNIRMYMIQTTVQLWVMLDDPPYCILEYTPALNGVQSTGNADQWAPRMACVRVSKAPGVTTRTFPVMET